MAWRTRTGDPQGRYVIFGLNNCEAGDDFLGFDIGTIGHESSSQDLARVLQTVAAGYDCRTELLHPGIPSSRLGLHLLRRWLWAGRTYPNQDTTASPDFGFFLAFTPKTGILGNVCCPAWLGIGRSNCSHRADSAGECMVRCHVSRLVRNGGFAVVAILTGFALSPRVAQASCGDYVWVGGRHAPLADSMPDKSTDASSPGQTNYHPPHEPCHGPGCSNRSFPTPAPNSVTIDSIERWALTASDALPYLVSCSSLLLEPPCIGTDGFRLSILRPPK